MNTEFFVKLATPIKRAGYKGNSDSAIARDIRKALWYENKYNELNNK